jgi:hypothetical protein
MHRVAARHPETQGREKSLEASLEEEYERARRTSQKKHLYQDNKHAIIILAVIAASVLFLAVMDAQGLTGKATMTPQAPMTTHEEPGNETIDDIDEQAPLAQATIDDDNT